MDYKLEELEQSQELLQNKPRWVHCMAVAVAVFFITMSTIAVGALLGYTYCYFEHRTTLRNAGNVTQSTNLQIIHIPYTESAEAKYNRTINGAIKGAINEVINGAGNAPIMSSAMISKIMNIGQAVVDNDLNCISLAGDDRSTNIL